MSAVGMHLMEAACGWGGRAGGQWQQWGRVAAMGHRACSGDRAGIGQESSYRSFVSCRSGKLRFHRGSKRERDINTGYRPGLQRCRGQRGETLSPASPHAPMGQGPVGAVPGWATPARSAWHLVLGFGSRHGARTGHLPVSGPHKEYPMPCPAPWQGPGAHRVWKQVWFPRLPHYISTFYPCSPHSAPVLHIDPPRTQTVPPAQCRTPSHPLATDPSYLARQPSPVPGAAGITHSCSPQGTAPWAWTPPTSAPDGHS